MDEAYRQGMSPAYVDWKQGAEIVPGWVSYPSTNQQKRAASIWHGAGFEGQQNAREAIANSNLKSEYDLMMGLYKIGYLLGIRPSGATRGDIENIKRSSGNDKADILIGLSAISDLMQAANPESRWSLDFITPQGAPGLKLNWKF